MNQIQQDYLIKTRREFLKHTGVGVGALGLATVFNDRLFAALPNAGHENHLAPRRPHFAPRAKSVIYIHLVGGASQLELFDPKPELVRRNGEKCPDHMFRGKKLAFIREHPTLLGSPFQFHRHGQGGMELSEHLPHLGSIADNLVLIRTVNTEQFNHAPAQLFLHTGFERFGRPGIGSWVSYGLGSENHNLPGYVVLITGSVAGAGNSLWGSGFLPATYQGTTLRPGPKPILNLQPPPDRSLSRQKSLNHFIRRFNLQHLAERDQADDLDARIRAYELAFRMQSAAPEIVDISRESTATRKLYALDQSERAEFGTRCLLARRMLERGVRFVQLYSGDTNGWDAHKGVLKNHSIWCNRTDQPIAGLFDDLKARGLWEDTLIIWGGEFGRMPMSEQGTGRDHNPWGYSIVLAGGAVKGGIAHGSTDPIGLRAEEGKVHIHDLHATLLHILGIDHKRLTVQHRGKDERLTDVEGTVVKEILA